MIKSMTGYGRNQKVINDRDILVEIRSVNHRYYEFTSRIPRAYGYLDDKLKSYVQGKISRGKVEVSVSIFNIEGKDALIEVNHSTAQGYINALRSANKELNLIDDLTLSQLVRFSDIFNVRKAVEDEDEIWNDVKSVADTAIDNFISMRETEGKKMKEDILSRLSYISELVEKVEGKSPVVTNNYRQRLYSKLCEVLNDNNIDEQRILTEAAIFSEKVAVDEETVRLKSHIHQFTDLMNIDEPVGRKLDFLIQEFNRESNTIGSKAQDIEITKIVVELKSEIEKIREQIQNIE